MYAANMDFYKVLMWQKPQACNTAAEITAAAKQATDSSAVVIKVNAAELSMQKNKMWLGCCQRHFVNS